MKGGRSGGQVGHTTAQYFRFSLGLFGAFFDWGGPSQRPRSRGIPVARPLIFAQLGRTPHRPRQRKK